MGIVPEGVNISQRRRFRLHALNYTWDGYLLYCWNYDGILLRCIPPWDVEKNIEKFHSGEAEGHYFGYTIVSKIIQARLY